MDNWQVTDDRFYDLLGRYVEALYPSTDTNVDGSSYSGDYFYSRSDDSAVRRYNALQALLNSRSSHVKIDQNPQETISEEDFIQFLGMKIV